MTGQTPSAADTPRSPLLIAALCGVGFGCVMFDQTALVLAVATIGRDLDASIAGLQWLTAIMPLMAATVIPVTGAVAARYGSRLTLRIGLLAFSSGAVLASLAPSLPALLGARAVQGVGAAMILPSGPALLGGNIPAGPTRQRAIGYWMTISSTGLFLGPLVSGLLVDRYSWRATFVVLVPLTLLGLAASTMIKNTARAKASSFDLAGLGLICLTLGTLSWALIETGQGSAPRPLVATAYLLAGLLFWFFLRVERRAENPIMNPALLGTPALRVLLPAVLVYNAVINGSAFVISIHLQEGRKLSAGLTGVMLVVSNLGMPLAGPLTTALRRVVRPGALILVSLGAALGSLVLLGLGQELPVPVLFVPLFLYGLAAGVLYSIDTTAILDTTEGPDSATTTATLALLRQTGTVLGIAALASVGQIAVGLGVSARGEQPALLIGGIVLLALIIRLAPRIGRATAS